MTDADNYKIKIKDLALFVRNVQLSPAVRMGHAKALEKTRCKYPIRRVDKQEWIIQKQCQHWVYKKQDEYKHI